MGKIIFISSQIAIDHFPPKKSSFVFMSNCSLWRISVIYMDKKEERTKKVWVWLASIVFCHWFCNLKSKKNWYALKKGKDKLSHSYFLLLGPWICWQYFLFNWCRSWLVDGRAIARKVKHATLPFADQIKDCGVKRECPNCFYCIDNSDVSYILYCFYACTVLYSFRIFHVSRAKALIMSTYWAWLPALLYLFSPSLFDKINISRSMFGQ